MNLSLFTSLVAMSFLWVGSQIPLYLFGSVLPAIYSDIGGYGRYLWMVIGYLIPVSALCPFVGALSDMFGRKAVGTTGQLLLIIGPIVTSTAKTMNTAIGMPRMTLYEYTLTDTIFFQAGQVISGLGAGLNELIALAGTSELVPKRKRGSYVGAIVFTILPFCPSVLWAQLILKASSWRYVGLVVGVWNFVGLILVLVFYKDPAAIVPVRPKKEILREVDYIGGFLSTAGVTCFMLGMQFGAVQVRHPGYREASSAMDRADLHIVHVAQRPCSGVIHHRHHRNHRLLRLGGLFRAIPNVSQKDPQQVSAKHDCGARDHLLQRCQLLRPSPFLADGGVQCLRYVNLVDNWRVSTRLTALYRR